MSTGERIIFDYRKNPFSLVYEGALTKNESGKVNIHPTKYKLNGLEIAANVYTPATYDPQKQYAAIAVAHPNGGVKEQTAGLDINFDTGVLLARRSHTVGSEVMETTKTGKDYRVILNPQLTEILRAHVAALPAGPMAESPLLFPSETGGYRSPSALDKPFRSVAEKLGLTKRVTPRAMRRTFQDLARHAHVADVVTRAISGHATENMQHHYSSVSDDEKLQATARIYSLTERRAAAASGGPSGGQAEETKKTGGT